MRNKFLALFLLCFTTIISIAQENKPVEMADKMRSSGKIYVVIAVILTILGGLILYVVRLDLKITKLEKSEKH